MYVQPHTIPKSFATLWIPMPSDAVLATAYSSLSAVDSDTTSCFLVQNLQTISTSLMITPAGTDRRVDLSPPQSASEYASSSPRCCQRNRHSARGFTTRYLPSILLTRSMSDTDGFGIGHHTCMGERRDPCQFSVIALRAALYLPPHQAARAS